jgi:hypothetical protein
MDSCRSVSPTCLRSYRASSRLSSLVSSTMPATTTRCCQLQSKSISNQQNQHQKHQTSPNESTKPKTKLRNKTNDDDDDGCDTRQSESVRVEQRRRERAIASRRTPLLGHDAFAFGSGRGGGGGGGGGEECVRSCGFSSVVVAMYHRTVVVHSRIETPKRSEDGEMVVVEGSLNG